VLLLTLNRRIHRAYNRVREHNFSLNGLVGFDIFGKTIGVVGTGKIGKIAAQILAGLKAPSSRTTRSLIRHGQNDTASNTPTSQRYWQPVTSFRCICRHCRRRSTCFPPKRCPK
jgi:phosphoglycerate dehydrogenase-like enzyme